MRKDKLLPITFLLFIGLTSFQVNTTKTSGKPRIKETINYLTGNLSTYFYSPQGYISRIQNNRGANSTYDYLKNKIIKHVNDSSSHTSKIDTLMLNKDGLMDQFYAGIQYSSPSPLEYDAEKHLIKSKMMDEKGRVMGMGVCDFVKGNQIKNTFYDENNKPYNTTLYTYYADKENTIGYENMGMPFMGTNSKNPIKESKTINASSPSDTLLNEYHYSFDEKGRISAKIMYNKSGKLIDPTGYRYY